MTISRCLTIALLTSLSLAETSAQTLKGVVKSPDGQPVERASIYFVKPPQLTEIDFEIRLLGETDELGQFEVEIPEDLSYGNNWLVVDKKPCAITSYPWNMRWPELPILRGADGLVLTLGKGVEIEGVLRTPEGVPIAGATVTPTLPVSIPGVDPFNPFCPPLDGMYGVKTGADGQFTLSRMPERQKYGLRLHDPGQGWSFFGIEGVDQMTRLQLSTEDRSVEAVPASCGAVEGVVLSRETGEPFPGAKVSAVLGGRDGNGRFVPTMEAITDEEGRYRFGGMPPSGYFLFAHADGKYNVAIECRLDSATSVTAKPLYLGDGIRFVGTIVDAVSEAPVTDAGIRLHLRREDAPQREATPVLHDDGTFEGRAAVGSVTLSIGSDKMDVLPEDKKKQLILAPNREHNLTIRVKPYDTVDIQVLNVDGTPAKDAVVVYRAEPDAPLICDEAGWAHQPLPDYKFTPGSSPFIVEAHAAGDESVRGLGPMKLTSPDTAKIVIALQPTATLTGILVDREGNPMPHEPIQVSRAKPSSGVGEQDKSTTDKDGRFTLRFLIPELRYSFATSGQNFQRVFKPGEQVEWKPVSKGGIPASLDGLPPEVISGLSPKMKRRLGIPGGEN